MRECRGEFIDDAAEVQQARKEAFIDDYIAHAMTDEGLISRLFEEHPNDFAKLFLGKQPMGEHINYLLENDALEAWGMR